MDFVRSPAFAVATGNRVDASKMIVSGSSAGGWLSFLAGTGIGYEACGLEPPSSSPVSGIAALYPITDLADPFWTTKQHPVSYMPRVIPDAEVAPFLDPTADKLAFTALDSKRAVFYHYMVGSLFTDAPLRPNTFSRCRSMSILNSVDFSNLYRGILEKLLLDGTGIPGSAFAVAPALKTGKFELPPTYVVHGDIDDKVPCRQARDVVEVLKQLKADVTYEELPGVNHLFDKNPECGMENMYAFVARVTK
jgi:acetyl esterase/lipase